MSFLTSTNIHDSASPVKTQYQPVFPLEYDGIYGPYAAITELEESISADFQNLLLTNPGEWPMNPELGIGLKNYLFEQHNSPELAKLKERIQKQLDLHLSGVNLIDVKVETNPEQVDQNLAKVTIVYSVLSGALITLESFINSIGGLSLVKGLSHRSFGNNARSLVDSNARLISDVIRR